MAFVVAVAAAALIALLRAGDQFGSALWGFGAVMLALSLMSLMPNTRSQRTRWRAQREATVPGHELSGGRIDLSVRADPFTITVGVVAGSLAVLGVAYLVSSAAAAAKRAEDAKPYKLFIDKPAADAAQKAGVDLELLVSRATDRVLALVPHTDQIKINVRLDSRETIPETGVGAIPGPGRSEVSITLNDKPKIGLGRSLSTWLPASLARILFLNSRARYGPGYGLTLGDALVSEGLSDHFVAQAFPKTPPQPWNHRPMTSRQEASLWHRATRDLIIPGSYDHSEWFLGTGSSEALPRWYGYTLAYRIVSPYLASDIRASAAVKTDAETVYKPYTITHQTTR